MVIIETAEELKAHADSLIEAKRKHWRELAKNYYRKHTDLLKERKKEYKARYRSNPEVLLKIKEYARNYYLKNKAKKRQRRQREKI